jgi:hypothetical protein
MFFQQRWSRLTDSAPRVVPFPSYEIVGRVCLPRSRSPGLCRLNFRQCTHEDLRRRSAQKAFNRLGRGVRGPRDDFRTDARWTGRVRGCEMWEKREVGGEDEARSVRRWRMHTTLFATRAWCGELPAKGSTAHRASDPGFAKRKAGAREGWMRHLHDCRGRTLPHRR